MFNRHTIRFLESSIKWLESERDSQRDRIWKLEGDLKLLAEHCGVKFEDTPPRRTLTTIKPDRNAT